MANESTRQQQPPPPDSGISSGAKVGIAIAAGFGVVALFAMGSWLWWRRRQKRQLAKDMINFVDGDIVNLVDGGRFEKRTDKPSAPYDPYYPSSSQSPTPSPVYQHSAPASMYHHSTSSTVYQHSTPSPTYPQIPPPPPEHHAGYYAPAPSREEPTPCLPQHVAPPPAIPVAEQNAWANIGRHPWSPPDYDAHSPANYDSADGDHTVNQAYTPSTEEDSKGVYPVEALPAILPDPRPQPQAELPAREGHYGWGHEQELPAPTQAPLRRQGPPQGHDIDEQKFLLADIMPIRQQKSRQQGEGSAG